jgi:hypothetical protein
MNSEDLTKEQCAAIKRRAAWMLAYLEKLNDRMSYKGFPADDPIKRVVADALVATKRLHSEVLSRSIGVTGLPDAPKPPVDLLFTRKSQPRKHEMLKPDKLS